MGPYHRHHPTGMYHQPPRMHHYGYSPYSQHNLMDTFWGRVMGIIIGIIILGAIILAIVSKLTASKPVVARFKPISYYEAPPTVSQKEVIQTLVNKVAPLVQGTRFDKEAIERIAGVNPDFDQVMYFHFRRLLESGNLNVTTLSRAISTGKSA